MSRQRQRIPALLSYVDLACAVAAGALWYVRPQLGPWPLVLVLAPWAVRWVLTGRPSRRTPLDAPLALFLATAGLAVWAAYHRETAGAKFWIVVGAIGIYYALANQPTTRHLRVFATLYALFGAGIAGYFLWTNDWTHTRAKTDIFVQLGEAIQALLPYLPGHRLHPTLVGGMLVMIVPFQIALLVGARGEKRNVWRWLVGLALLLTVFALLLTISRAAWLALILGLGLWALWKASALFPSRLEGSLRIRKRCIRFATWLAALVLVVGVLLLLVPGGPLQWLSALPGQNVLPDRASLWSRATYLIQDVPFTGGGLDSFSALDSAYAQPITQWNRYRLHVWVSNPHSHNLWLDVGVEQGLLGLVALLWIVGAFAVVVWQGWRTAAWQNGTDRWGRLLVEAAVASALVVVVHSLVDDVPYGSRAMLLFFVPMGVVVAQARWWRPRFNVSRLAVVVPIVVVVLGLAALIWRRPLTAAWQANLGAVVQARIELVDYLEEDWSLYRVRAEADLSRAIVHFEQALLLEPEQPTANLRLGLIRLGRGEYEAAIPLLERAYELRPGLQAARQALAEAYLVTGRLDEAATLWAGVDEAEIKLQRMTRQYQRLGDEARAADAAWVAEQVHREK